MNIGGQEALEIWREKRVTIEQDRIVDGKNILTKGETVTWERGHSGRCKEVEFSRELQVNRL